MNKFKSNFLKGYNSKLKKLENSKKILSGLFLTLVAHKSCLNKKIKNKIISNINWNSKIAISSDIDGAKRTIEILKKKGIESIKPKNIRIDNSLTLQGNFIRSIKPKRLSNTIKLPNPKIFKPFNENEFNFLNKDAKGQDFFKTTINSISLTAIFNRYAYAKVNCLLIPNITKKHPQYIDPNNHTDNKILETISNLPTSKYLGKNFRVIFNGLNANASVNHMHFQGFFVDKNFKIPVENFIPKNTKEKTLISWPFKNTFFIPRNKNMINETMKIIDEVNTRNKQGESISYNLTFCPNGIIIKIRKNQGDKVFKGGAPFGTSTLEMNGLIIVSMENLTKYNKNKESEKNKIINFLRKL